MTHFRDELDHSHWFVPAAVAESERRRDRALEQVDGGRHAETLCDSAAERPARLDNRSYEPSRRPRTRQNPRAPLIMWLGEMEASDQVRQYGRDDLVGWAIPTTCNSRMLVDNGQLRRR